MDNAGVTMPASIQQLNRLLDPADAGWYLNWLVWACGQLPNAAAALLITDDDFTGQFHARAIWPVESRYDELLKNAAEVTLKKKQPLITPLDDGKHHLGSYPVFIDGILRAVVTVLFSAGAAVDLQKTLTIIEYCSAWLELHLGRSLLTTQKNQNERQHIVIDGIASVLGERDFEHAALRFVNLLGRRLQAERVVLGFVKAGEIAIHSESDSSGNANKHELLKLTAKAMQECVDQQESIGWPVQEGCSQITVAHGKLAEAEGQRTLLTVPLVDKELCYGAVLFERGPDTLFSREDQLTAEAMANFIGVVLEEKRQSSLPLYAYVGRSLHNQASHLLGPGYLLRKIVLLVVVVATLFFSFMPGAYNIGADAVLEGAELRAVVVPFDGYLQNASLRAGDSVAKGTVLAELDTRELRLQRMSWLSQQATARRQYEDALAKQERTQVQVSNAQMQRAQAELELIDYEISQAKLLAPFDALIVSGDLSQRIGSVVKQGEVLFELSPSKRFRLAIYIDEFRINDIRQQQTGKLVLAALSDMEFPFTVTRINPVAEVREGATVYRVEADLAAQDDELRVGLEGAAQVYVDQRLLISVWTRSLTDWLRLQLWRIWG